MALNVLDRAKTIHLFHNGTTKKGVSFISISARVTIDGVTQDVPVHFQITCDGKGETECAAVVESLSSKIPQLNELLQSSGDKTLLKTASLISNGATNATKTSKLVGEAKQSAVERVAALHGANSPEM